MSPSERKLLKAEAAIATILAEVPNTYPEEERRLKEALGTLHEIRSRVS